MKPRVPILNAAILVLVFVTAAAQSTEIERLRSEAEQGSASAQHNLGLMYDLGMSVPQDDQEAVKWYRLAAEQGNPFGQYNLALMYDLGRGVAQDYVQAHKWINLAVSGMNPGIEDVSDYRSARDEVAKKMTTPQVAEAQRLAREWQPKTWEQLKDE